MAKQGTCGHPPLLVTGSLASFLQAIAIYLDLARLEYDVALEAAMLSDDDDVDWIE